MKLDDYRTLGRTGLAVSPLCLGTMTFGSDWGWGADETTACAMFDRYLDLGGNFVDTANLYTNGQSERLVGRFIKERGVRDRVVLSTKFTFHTGDPKNPNAGGNGRKNVHQALDASLKRLGTDYVDLYFLHAWDMRTPVEEVGETMAALVASGKVRYFGLSDVPAWYVARYQTLAERSGWPRAAAVQLEYSLVERSIEREHVPAARELGIGIIPWSPLANGFLAGKYRREDGRTKGEGRLGVFGTSSNPTFAARSRPSEKMWRTLDAVKAIATELGRTPAEVSLAWVHGRPGVTTTLLGATRVAQLDANIAAAELKLHAAARMRLDEVSALDVVHPYDIFTDTFQASIYGGAHVTSWTA